MKTKFKYKVGPFDGCWALFLQVRPRGKWRVCCNEAGDPTCYRDQNEADLQCFIAQRGPRYERWFEQRFMF